MTRRIASAALLSVFALAIAFAVPCRGEAAVAPEGPLVGLQSMLALAVTRAPGRVGIAIEDLATGATSGVNASADLPAASTIKIPVMVEVFRQLERGTIDLNTHVTLERSDRDWGWGDLADAPVGGTYDVHALLWAMITRSDNTATNMLIRLVGRRNINRTMWNLGLHRTHIADYLRSDSDSIRYGLRTSPHDMLALLDAIARGKLVDAWASRQMFAILAGQTHNGLLPAALPSAVKIAHKTGSLHDTLNDVGIVYSDGEPYVIAVMTTRLSDLDLGRTFIHRVSRLTYGAFTRFAAWREERRIAAFDISRPLAPAIAAVAPDLTMWDQSARTAVPGAPALRFPTQSDASSDT